MFSIAEELLSRKDLIRELVLKDLKVRYCRPVLGFFWAFLSPLFIVTIFYFVFSSILRLKTEEAPFFLYLMSAVFSWQFFQDSLFGSTTSLIDNKNLIKESNFPHYLIPVSIVLSNAINFLPALIITVFVSLFVLKGLPVLVVFLPIVLAIHLAVVTGLAILFSILYVKWRDIKYILAIALTLLFYLTPSFYSIYMVKATFSPHFFLAYIYNPFVGILNLYRFVLLKGFYGFVHKDISFLSFAIAPACFAFLILISGFWYYGKNKNIINDYLSY